MELSQSDQRGVICVDEGIAIINLYGSWHQMGRQYGILAKDRMEDVLNYLEGKLGSDPVKEAAANIIADNLYSHYPDHLKEFFDGVCSTSGLSLDRLRLCNAAEYVEGCFLCSAMAVWTDYGSGKLVFGRNYDALNYDEIGKDLVVTVYHPDGKAPAATVGYAGEIYCVNGFNSSRLFVELNNGMPSAGTEIHWDLCPSTTSLFEMLFEARTLDDVEAFFRDTRSFSSLIIGVADRHEARSYEWCYEGVKRGDEMTDKGLMISTNHYVHKDWVFDTPGNENSWNSILRRCNLLDKAGRNKGRIDVEKMKEIMSTSLEEGGPLHEFTRYQIIAVPEDMTLYLNFPYNGRWVEIDMRKYFCY